MQGVVFIGAEKLLQKGLILIRRLRKWVAKSEGVIKFNPFYVLTSITHNTTSVSHRDQRAKE